jgi:VIT1/CCC1 family predicted Fe2+/Mn2+ transporter
MARTTAQLEGHRSSRVGWLRAAVLGANDGLLSVASLIVGVAAANNDRTAIGIAGIAAMAAGAFSMAVGEFSSVSSQRDTERADLAREAQELLEDPRSEAFELAGIYERRGLPKELAREVADKMMEKDPLESHARDELGIDLNNLAKPTQAAIVSAVSFVLGALLPITVALLAPDSIRIIATTIATVALLAGLGVLGANLGGAPRMRAALRIAIGGSAALALTTLVGAATGQIVG